ncbi:hypothetical protein DXA96_11310 [Lachnospiraceae bacterium OF09-33XD]|nr:hypothetical protein DXA96_11310 [Lachnospiraceae bacterium OF09-33XD]
MRKTDQLLQQAKFSKRYQGYHYLLLCVELAAEDELRLCSLIKQIYQPVADQYQLTYQDIEKYPDRPGLCLAEWGKRISGGHQRRKVL